MKTKLNKKEVEAATDIASRWLTTCEQMLDVNPVCSPYPLSKMGRWDLQAYQIDSNRQMTLENWEAMKARAIEYAKTVLVTIGAERYPLTLKNFSKKG